MEKSISNNRAINANEKKSQETTASPKLVVGYLCAVHDKIRITTV